MGPFLGGGQKRVCLQGNPAGSGSHHKGPLLETGNSEWPGGGFTLVPPFPYQKKAFTFLGLVFSSREKKVSSVTY